LPTREEQQELVNQAVWTKTKLNNVDGYRVSGPNGNSIFLPAGGGRIGTTIHYRVSGADFWSGTLSANTEEAHYMWFYGGRQAVEDLPRHYGFSIRPVMEYGNDHISVDDTVSTILNHSAFEGFGRYLMPWDSNRDYNIPIAQVASLMPYHRNVVPHVVTDSVNYMIDEVSEGKTIFYDFYTRQDKNADPTKNNAGLFFFRGNPNAPFVLLVPGGGFSYVGSLHEGFPLAVEITQKGYNAFVLKYRPSRTAIVEDTAAVLRYIFDNAGSLRVDTDDYSLWGLSAGGESVAAISLETVEYGGIAVPKPSTAVFIYAWQRYFSKDDPAVFSAIGEDDRIGSVPRLEEAVAASKAAGADIEYHCFPDTGHGFGLGTGTNAEGWLDMAVQFWEKHIGLVQ
jgi:acetyl esterase/lipase